jgi:glutamate--cysteine ligase
MEMITHDIRTRAITRYIARGCVPHEQSRIGFELEHFVVDAKSKALVPYLTDPTTGKPGVEYILTELAPYYDVPLWERRNDGTESLIGLTRSQLSITLEPGAQLELSIGPQVHISALEKLYLEFRRELDPILESCGYMLVACGYHPSACAHEIPLIPKDRYAYMDEYFTHTGTRGICMMRASAAAQTSIDFCDERDAIRKLRVACILGPFFAFLTDNSPVYEGVQVGSCKNTEHAGAEHVGANERLSPQSGRAIPHRMARITSWDDCDPHRCLVPPALFDDDYGFESYATGLLRMPAIFAVSPDADSDPAAAATATAYVGFTPHESLLPLEDMDEDSIERVLGLCFYDVRLKNYLEIRQADSMPLVYMLAFLALVKGIFSQEAALNYYEEQFSYLDSAAIARAKSALRKQGYAATVYQRPAAAWLDELMAYAAKGLCAEEQAYLKPFVELVKDRMTVLDVQQCDMQES